MKKTHGTGIKFVILALLFALVFFGSFWVGRYDVSPLQTLRILADWLLRTLSRGRLALTQTWQVRAQAVVLNVRLPRVAAAALVGAALSTAGCAYQGMFRNPMVSPDLLGASTGAGFGAAKLRGSENNDAFSVENGKIVTETNRCGGILGGITDGMPIVLRAAFKPTPSIARTQQSVNLQSVTREELAITGRHDPCIVPRAVPCVEAAVAVAVYDALLARRKEKR